MNLTRDYIEFRKLTKPVRDDFDLDLIPDMGLGTFFPHRLDGLKFAEGDADPDLWFCDSGCQELFKYSEIRRFDRI